MGLKYTPEWWVEELSALSSSLSLLKPENLESLSEQDVGLVLDLCKSSVGRK
jgi:hypothetical protein